MTHLTNRHAAYAMLAVSLALLIYLVTAEWTFVEMRDGTLIGAFPLTYVGLCIVFAITFGVGKAGREVLADSSLPTLNGLLRIGTFLAGGLLLAFFHETLGFVSLAVVFLAVNALFLGQRLAFGVVLYSILVCGVLYGLFTMLGFDLTIFPSSDIFGIGS